MKISWNWLSEIVDLSKVGGPSGLARHLTSRGLEVEGIHSQAAGLDGVVSVKILEKNRHPEADRLSLCKVTLGQGEPLEIVCGAQNMKAGDVVALAQIGALLPNGLKIEKSKIRGVLSHGMLCSEEELGFKAESEGILILPPSTPLGKPLAEILGKNDTVFELSLTPNRGDCLSHLGIAREISAALEIPLQWKAPNLVSLDQKTKKMTLDAGALSLQFFGVSIEGVKVGPSPKWLVDRLEAIGARSINNVVDATNYVMHELGQPMHAYDLNRLNGETMSIRLAQVGEKLPLLDSTEVKLVGEELVIADSKQAVALAGVMGGGNSEVQDSTKNLFLECAEFDPGTVRKAARIHVKHTDASHRFERGIDGMGLHLAISRLTQLILELAGGKVVGAGSTIHASRKADIQKARKILVKPGFFSDVLGFEVNPATAEKIFKGLGCRMVSQSNSWEVYPPSWRNDLHIPEDLSEEIARSVGYDHIPSTIPALSKAPLPATADATTAGFALLQRAKDALVRVGFSEVVNYSFTSRKHLADFGMESLLAVQNPLSEEQEVMVPSLIPMLLKNVSDNFSRHFGSEPLPLRFFEIRPVFSTAGQVGANGQVETGVIETWKLAFVFSGPRLAEGLRAERGEIDFVDLKGVLDGFLSLIGAKGVRYRKGSSSSLFHPGQSAELWVGPGSAGSLGRLHPKFEKNLKSRQAIYVGELDWQALSKAMRGLGQNPAYKPWSEWPSIERDFALVVSKGTEAEQITQLALKAGKPLAKSARVFDIYEGSQVEAGKMSIAVRVVYGDETRSLKEEEAEKASQQILNLWKKELGAVIR